MLNKMFESIARKQLTENAFDRWCWNRHYRMADKIGAITRFADGTEACDMIKVRAHGLKKSALMLGVFYPTAAIIGHVLGNVNSKN